jgi:hypothetical protein
MVFQDQYLMKKPRIYDNEMFHTTPKEMLLTGIILSHHLFFFLNEASSSGLIPF